MPTQAHNLRMGSGGEGFVAAHSLTAVEVGVHARVKFVHHVALVGASGVWCRSGVGAMNAVASSAGPVGPGRTGRVRGAVSASGAGCVVAMAGFEPRVGLVQHGGVMGTMVARSVSSAGCAGCAVGSVGAMGGSAMCSMGTEARSVFSGGASSISSSASVGTRMNTVGFGVGAVGASSAGTAMVEIRVNPRIHLVGDVRVVGTIIG